MAKEKIEVFVTKKGKFRARITEPYHENDPITAKVGEPFTYEVTVGGQGWGEGKGKKYRTKIKQKCERILDNLQDEFENAFGEQIPFASGPGR